MVFKIKKGSTAWYRAMNLELLRHADGIRAINYHTNLREKINLKKMLKQFLLDKDTEFLPVKNQLSEFEQKFLSHLKARIKKYLA